ncbi:hypothetical protein ACWCPQ_12335 [Nocardia sp. NPDC001965]
MTTHYAKPSGPYADAEVAVERDSIQYGLFRRHGAGIRQAT